MQRIDTAKRQYLGRKGYQPVAGTHVFAMHGATCKAVALYNGTFNRHAFREVHDEAATMGLSRLTILVNGLVTYSGGTITTIRVDAGAEEVFMAEDIHKDLMSDVTAARQLKRQAN